MPTHLQLAWVAKPRRSYHGAQFLGLVWHLRPFCPWAQNIPAPRVLLMPSYCQGKDNLASSHLLLQAPGPVLTLLVTRGYLPYGYLYQLRVQTSGFLLSNPDT